MIIKDILPCPNCGGDMVVWWMQYDNPEDPKTPMTLQRVRYGCNECPHAEIWKVVEVERAKAEIEPRRNMRVWKQ